MSPSSEAHQPHEARHTNEVARRNRPRVAAFTTNDGHKGIYTHPNYHLETSDINM